MSVSVLRLIADITPIGIAIAKIKNRDSAFKSIDAGRRSNIFLIAGRPSLNESPKSNLTTLLSHEKYWRYHGLSKP